MHCAAVLVRIAAAWRPGMPNESPANAVRCQVDILVEKGTILTRIKIGAYKSRTSPRRRAGGELIYLYWGTRRLRV